MAAERQVMLIARQPIRLDDGTRAEIGADFEVTEDQAKRLVAKEAAEAVKEAEKPAKGRKGQEAGSGGE